MHRCQGFGAMSTRGESVDWFDFIKGERPPGQDPFAGINTTWTRVEGGEKIGQLLSKIDREYRSDNPAASVPDLLAAMQLIKALPDGHWKQVKLADIKEVIRGCLGLYLEATAAEPTATPGENIKIHLEAINRAPAEAGSVTLGSVSIQPGMYDTVYAFTLLSNKDFTADRTVKIPANAPFTSPYWLLNPPSTGMYNVDKQQLRGLPETPRFATVHWSVTVNGVPLEYDTDVAYKTEESAVGEVWRPFEVLPPVFVEFTETSYLATGKTVPVTVRVKAGRDSVRCKIQLNCPDSWVNEQTARKLPEIALARKGEEIEYTFDLTPPAGSAATTLTASADVDGKTYSYRLVTVKYDHIPQQNVLLPATAPAARLDLKVSAQNIGYIMGAGDEVPAALHQMGCSVTLLKDNDLEAEHLKKFDAIVIGIRAYNTKENLKFYQQKLLDYVQNGGTLVVQYNTSNELVLDQLAPYPMKLSRTRVTDENAEIRFRIPDHAVLNTPNKLTARDFDGWVQERGLYFPGEWDAAFEAPLSSNDPGEPPADGSLLVARYGKGYYIYTGLSFFRELPAGVPGAYRLFANLISLGKQQP